MQTKVARVAEAVALFDREGVEAAGLFDAAAEEAEEDATAEF